MQIAYFLIARKNSELDRVSCDRVQVIFLFVHVVVTHE